MAKKKFTKEELETMSYNDIAHILLKEKKKTINSWFIYKNCGNVRITKKSTRT